MDNDHSSKNPSGDQHKTYRHKDEVIGSDKPSSYSCLHGRKFPWEQDYREGDTSNKNNGKSKFELTKSLEEILNAYYSKTKRKNIYDSKWLVDNSNNPSTNTTSTTHHAISSEMKNSTSNINNKKKKKKSGQKQKNEEDIYLLRLTSSSSNVSLYSETFEPDYSDFPRSNKTKKKSSKKKKKQINRKRRHKSASSSPENDYSTSDPLPRSKGGGNNTTTTKKEARIKRNKEKDDDDDDDDNHETSEGESDCPSLPPKKKRRKKRITRSKKSASNKKATNRKRSLCEKKRRSRSKSCCEKCTFSKNRFKRKRKSSSSDGESDCKKCSSSKKRRSKSGHKSCHSKKSPPGKERSRSCSSYCCNSHRNCNCRERSSSPPPPPSRRKNKRTLFQRLFTHLGLVRTKNSCGCRLKNTRNEGDCTTKKEKVENCRRSGSESTCCRREKRPRSTCRCSCHDDERKKLPKHDDDGESPPPKKVNNCRGSIWDYFFGKSTTTKDDKKDDKNGNKGNEKGCKCGHKLKSKSSSPSSSSSKNKKEDYCRQSRPKEKQCKCHYYDDVGSSAKLNNNNDFVNLNDQSVKNFGIPGMNNKNNYCSLPKSTPSSSAALDAKEHPCCSSDVDCECPYCPLQFEDDLELSDVKVSPVCACLITDYVSEELAQMLDKKLTGVEEKLQEEERQFWAEYIGRCDCPVCTSRHNCELHVRK